MKRFIKGQLKIESNDINVNNFEEVMELKNAGSWIDEMMHQLNCDIAIFVGMNDNNEKYIICEYYIENRTITECRSVLSQLKKYLKNFFDCKISLVMSFEGTVR